MRPFRKTRADNAAPQAPGLPSPQGAAAAPQPSPQPSPQPGGTKPRQVTVRAEPTLGKAAPVPARAEPQSGSGPGSGGAPGLPHPQAVRVGHVTAVSGSRISAILHSDSEYLRAGSLGVT